MSKHGHIIQICEGKIKSKGKEGKETKDEVIKLAQDWNEVWNQVDWGQGIKERQSPHQPCGPRRA